MLLLLALACTSDDKRDPTDRTADPGDDTGGDDTGGDDTGGDDTGEPVEGCRATPAAADRDRVVLVSLPYTEDADRSDIWAVLTLSSAGELTDDGTRVTMGRASIGEVAFTPDGSLALVATENGEVAVYDVANGVVVHEGYQEGFYAGKVVVDPSGEVAWVIDSNWVNNGGGVYRVDIDCETGALAGGTRVLESKLPTELLWVDGDALVVGRDIAGAEAGDDIARLTWGDTPAFVAGADAFGDDDAIVSDAALVGGWALIADHSEFSGVPTRVARVRVNDGLAVESAVEIEDPMSIVAFPDGSARALVASGYGDAYFVLDADAGTTSNVSASRVQLPGSMVDVTRGPLDGHVLASEVGGVRQLQLSASGVVDQGVFSFGDGIEDIVGAIGVAP